MLTSCLVTVRLFRQPLGQHTCAQRSTDIPPDIFQKLTANGVQGDVYQNVRKNTNNNSPVTDLASPDLRCNVGGASGASTSTVSVAAGSSITFTADIAVYHQGPVSLYVT